MHSSIQGQLYNDNGLYNDIIFNKYYVSKRNGHTSNRNKKDCRKSFPEGAWGAQRPVQFFTCTNQATLKGAFEAEGFQTGRGHSILLRFWFRIFIIFLASLSSGFSCLIQYMRFFWFNY